jgi:hypothetical protein
MAVFETLAVHALPGMVAKYTRWRLDAARIRYGIRYGLPRKILVDLQICHLNNCPGDDRDDNLRACCGWCHCNLDLQFHKQTRAARKDRARPLLSAV